MLPKIAIIAGGLATRLYPKTQSIPKSMLPVADQPFIYWQLKLLKAKGLTDVVVCTGYLGEQLQEYIKDGKGFGLNVTYSSDGEKLLGTGGAIKKALPLLGDKFFIVYGDSYLDTDYRAIADFYNKQDKLGLMTVFNNNNRWDKSNVEFKNGTIFQYAKKNQTPEMNYVDYGLGLLHKDCFENYNGAFDLADVYQNLLKQGQLLGYEVKERFYEIGSASGLEELNKKIQEENKK